MTELIHTKIQLLRPSFSLDVDTMIPARGVTIIFGQSGSGKTTLLRCIAGLERSEIGEVRFKGETWQDSSQFLPTHKRQIGYVFQEASLFAHLSARKNLQFALKRASRVKALVSFDHVVALLDIGKLLDRYPSELSGGERQRIAIARALLINPKLLLMDEPLASLDEARKQEILPYLATLKKELSLPILYVTHSANELARLADHLVVMREGKVVAEGDLSSTLSSLDLPIRFGEDAGVVLDAHVAERDAQWQLAKIHFAEQGALWFKDTGEAIGDSVRIRVLARDVSLTLEPPSASSILNCLPATVIGMREDGHPAQTLVKLAVFDRTILARVSSKSASELGLKPELALWAQIKSVAIVN